MESKKPIKGGEFIIRETACENIFTPEDYTEEQKMIAQMCLDFISAEVLPNLEKIDHQEEGLMQKLLDEYHTGVTINNVQLQKVDPPAAVVDAFNEVQRARQEKEKLKNQAEAYRNDIIPRAKGEAVKMQQDAEAYKQQVVSRATGDASRFSSIFAAYKNAPQVTSERMYLETLEEIIKNTKTVVLDNKNSNVLPYLPLNDLKKEQKLNET